MDFIHDKTNSNIWEEESEGGYDEEYIQNEIPPPPINNEFVDNILKIKHSLYDDIILSPRLGTKEAQDNNLIQKYLEQLNKVYILTINAKKGIIDDKSLTRYSPKTRELIKNTLVWISNYFKHNNIMDIIPYEDYLHKMFREYQFIQDNSFE